MPRRRRPLTLKHERRIRRRVAAASSSEQLDPVATVQASGSEDELGEVTMEEESIEAMCDDSCSCNGHICALSNRISQMEELLDKVLDQLKIKEKEKLSADSTHIKLTVSSLREAAKLKNTPALARFLARGADPNAVDKDGNTALHCAARSGDALAAELLLACGAALEAKNKNADTPLLVAAWCRHIEVAKILIQEGAQIDQPNMDGQTPLMCAVILQHADMVFFLKSRGASLDVKDACGDTPIIIAAKNASSVCLMILMSSPRTSVEELMKALEVAGSRRTFRILKNAVPVSKICATKFSLLPRLAARGWEKPIELLLYDCRMCEDEDHMKNLQQAVSVAVSAHVLMILWNSKPMQLQKFAIHRATVQRWGKELKIILQHGRTHGGTVYHLDKVMESMQVARDPPPMLQLAKAKPQISNSNTAYEGFWMSADRGWKTKLSRLIRMGVPVDVARPNGCTALHYAAERGHDTCVKLLLSEGASPNVRNDVGWTPLHVAADAGHRAVMKSLLSAGADPNIKDPVGCTPSNVGIVRDDIKAAEKIIDNVQDL